MHEYFSNFKKFIILKKIMWKKNFIWWKTSSFLGKIFNGKILRFFRQKWPLFWSKFLYFGYPENISGFRVLNVGFQVGFGYRPLGFRSGSGGLKCRVYPSGFRVPWHITTLSTLSMHITGNVYILSSTESQNFG